MVLCLDTGGLFTFVNETACRVFGRPREALIGHSWRDFVNADDLDATAARIAASLTPPHPRVRVENRILTPEGERWYAWEGAPVPLDDGQHLEVQAVGRDITEAKRAEDERRNQLLFMTSLIDAIPAAVSYKTDQGIYLGCNRMFADLIGRPADQIIGRTADDLVTPDHAVTIRASDRGIFETLEPHTYDLTWGTDGARHLRVCKAPFHRADGSLGGLIGIILDLTSDIRREDELRLAREAAEQASRAKSGFLANMSHEIRTPMNAILGLIYLLEQTELTQVQRDYARKAQLSAQSLLGILNDVLDLSKIEAGRLELEAVPFRLDDLLRTLAAITAANARDKDIEVLFQVAPDTPLALVGDPLRLQQVLLNLTGNATKFTSRGEVVLSVEPVTVGTDAVRLAFTVRDTGVGIPPDQIRAIFDPFTQADASTSRCYGGTGLGLSICRRLVELMDGGISVNSEPGRGSAFRFTAAFRPATEELAPPAPPPELAGPLRVLVADDNQTAREIMVTMVTRFGWHATVAASGGEALAAIDRALAAGQPFDLILLDWVMPEIGGREIIAHVHHRHRFGNQPMVLVVTAFEHDRVRREAGQDPRVGVILTKPVTPSALLDAVASTRSLEPMAPQAPVGSSVLAGRLLLLVEDNAINQMVARRILESAGATVEVAGSGLEALATLEAPGKRFDAVLMDIQIPGMDGYETTRRLRERHRATALPVIAMTANALPSDRERCLAAGMNDHIGKPLDVARMMEVILRHVGARLPVSEALPELELSAAKARCVGNDGLLRQVMEEFIRQFSGEPEILARQLAGGDLSAIARKAHDLKGVAGNIGAVGLARQATLLHTAVRQGDADLARATGREVCRLLTIVLASCVRWLAGPPPDQDMAGE